MEAVLKGLAQNKNKFLKLEQLSAFLSTYLEKDVAVILAKVAISLRRLADRYARPVPSILAALANGLKEHGWTDEQMKMWEGIREPLEAIIADTNIELVTKAADLYYGDSYHIHDLKVVTDIRPVLSETRDKVDASIVRNTLFLRYSGVDEREGTLQLSIAYSELERFRDEFGRAIQKTDLLKRVVEEDLSVPSMIYDRDW